MFIQQIEAEEITLREFVELNPRLAEAVKIRKENKAAERETINIRLTECADGVFRPIITKTDYRKEKDCCGGSGKGFKQGGVTFKFMDGSEWIIGRT